MYRLQQFIEQLNTRFFNREEVIRGLLIGLITQSNVLLIGPPGTAKSSLVNNLVDRLQGVKCFSYLMTKFTRPDEIIGPISLQGLEKDELNRVLEGRLADAHVAFLDEVFNSNSGCLNAVLSIINEKRFLNGTKVVKVPLIMLVGAANQVPAEVSGVLSAFYDRFLLRYQIDYLSGGELRKLVTEESKDISSLGLSLADLQWAQEMVTTINLPEEVLMRLVAMVSELRSRGLPISDRRVKQSCAVLRAAALIAGREEVELKDLDMLRYVFWFNDQDRHIFDEVLSLLTKPVLNQVGRISDEAERLFNEISCSGGSLKERVKTGAKLMELKEELLELLQVYNRDALLAGEIQTEVGRVDNLVSAVYQNMFAPKGDYSN